MTLSLGRSGTTNNQSLHNTTEWLKRHVTFETIYQSDQPKDKDKDKDHLVSWILRVKGTFWTSPYVRWGSNSPVPNFPKFAECSWWALKLVSNTFMPSSHYKCTASAQNTCKRVVYFSCLFLFELFKWENVKEHCIAVGLHVNFDIVQQIYTLQQLNCCLSSCWEFNVCLL